MQALTFVLSMRPAIPMSIEKPCTIATNSEVSRWLNNGAVKINGCFPKSKDNITLPVNQLIFFHKSSVRKCTIF